MKIRIDKKGALQIERSGTLKPQYCHKASGTVFVFCGDHCPLFGEPEDYKECQIPRKTVCPTGECDECQHNKPAGQRITICQDRTLYGTIEDMRRSA